jgi:transposase
VVEAIAYRSRTGIPWRKCRVSRSGRGKTAWKRHRRYAWDGTWDRILARLLSEADAAGQIQRGRRRRCGC